MTIIDDRNDLQKNTHVWAVVATDKCMSGWGGAKGGKSIVAWAVDDLSKTSKLFDWVDVRSEMKCANVVNLNKYRSPRGTSHFHIYLVNDGHPAFAA
jgi:hypothetical protein